MTPEEFGPSDSGYTGEVLSRMRSETLDAAIARYVGYAIDNDRVKLEETRDGWKATVRSMTDGGPRVILGFRKQQVLNLVFSELYPRATFAV